MPARNLPFRAAGGAAIGDLLVIGEQVTDCGIVVTLTAFLQNGSTTRWSGSSSTPRSSGSHGPRHPLIAVVVPCRGNCQAIAAPGQSYLLAGSVGGIAERRPAREWCAEVVLEGDTRPLGLNKGERDRRAMMRRDNT